MRTHPQEKHRSFEEKIEKSIKKKIKSWELGNRKHCQNKMQQESEATAH